MAVGLAVSNIDKVIGRRGQVIMLDVQFRTTYCIFNETLGLAQSDDQICLGSRSGSRNFFRNYSKLQNGSFSAICALRAHFYFSYCLEWGYLSLKHNGERWRSFKTAIQHDTSFQSPVHVSATFML